MPTLEEVKHQLSQIEGSGYLGLREIAELPSILLGDEAICDLIRGDLHRAKGILVATNKRLVFVSKKSFGGVRVEEYGYDRIDALQYETGMLSARLVIVTQVREVEVTQVSKERVASFSATVRGCLGSSHSSQATPPIDEKVRTPEVTTEQEANPASTDKEEATPPREGPMGLLDRATASPLRLMILLGGVALILISPDFRMVVFFLLFFACLVALLVGLGRPKSVIRWHGAPNRYHVMAYGVTGTLVCFMVADQAQESAVRNDELSRARAFAAGDSLFTEAKAAFAVRSEKALDLLEKSEKTFRKAGRHDTAAVVTAYRDSIGAIFDEIEEQKRVEQDRIEEQKRIEQEAEKRRMEEAQYTTKPGTLARTVEEHVHHVIGKEHTWSNGKVKSVIRVRLGRHPASGYTAHLTYRQSEPLFGSVRGRVVRSANKMMRRIYTDGKCSSIRKVTLRPYYQLVDKYGQSFEAEVAVLSLERRFANRVNWEAMSLDDDMFRRLIQSDGSLWFHDAL